MQHYGWTDGLNITQGQIPRNLETECLTKRKKSMIFFVELAIEESNKKTNIWYLQ